MRNVTFSLFSFRLELCCLRCWHCDRLRGWLRGWHCDRLRCWLCDRLRCWHWDGHWHYCGCCPLTVNSLDAFQICFIAEFNRIPQSADMLFLLELENLRMPCNYYAWIEVTLYSLINEMKNYFIFHWLIYINFNFNFFIMSWYCEVYKKYICFSFNEKMDSFSLLIWTLCLW